MAGVSFSTYDAFGETLLENTGYHQAVRIGGRIETSGQCGWDHQTGHVPEDINTEIDNVFENVDLALKSAGGNGWSQVYRIRLFTVGATMEGEPLARVIANIKARTGGSEDSSKRPILTGVGVEKLASPAYHLEMEVAAYDPRE